MTGTRPRSSRRYREVFSNQGGILPSQSVKEHRHLPRGLLHRRILYCVLESQSLHRFQEDRRFITSGVGEDHLAAGREELRREIREGGGVLALVEDVRGDNEVEAPHTPDLGLAPVEDGDVWPQAKVRTGVVGRELEGRLVVVRREDLCAAGEGCDGWKSDTAPEFDGASSSKVEGREVTSQGEGARPEFGPVG